MFDQLLDLVRSSGQQAVVENPDVPNEHNEAVMEEAASSVQSGMQEIYQKDGPRGLKQLFEGAEAQDPDNPQVQHLTNNFSGNLMQKFGLGSGVAKSIGAALIPMVLSRLFRRTKDPNDSGFSIGGLLSSLAGGGLGGMLGGGLGGMFGGGGQAAPAPASAGGGGMLSNIGNKLGLDKDGDGDTDLKDLMGMFR